MKTLLIAITLCICTLCIGQNDERITTIDFVEIIKGNSDEANFYYENNWKPLREMALDLGYIHSFEILDTPHSKDAPFHLMLVTTYKNKTQYNFREDHFEELLEKRGDLKLMNKKQPNEFRKILFSKELVKHRI